MSSNAKFILAVALAAFSLTAIAVSAVKCGEIMGHTVTETLLVLVPLYSTGFLIITILLFVAVCNERDAAQRNNQLPKRRSR